MQFKLSVCCCLTWLMLGVARAAPAGADWRVVSATLTRGDTAVQITYRNGQVVTIRKIYPEESFDPPVISQDRLSVGWSVERRVDASYAIPADAHIYRNGRAIVPWYCPGGVIEYWQFEAGGKWVSFEQGNPHGVPQEHWCLVDVANGHVLGRVNVDDDTGKVPPGAPAWAR